MAASAALRRPRSFAPAGRWILVAFALAIVLDLAQFVAGRPAARTVSSRLLLPTE